MPSKTKPELLKSARECIKEIRASRLTPEEKARQFVPYLRILRSLDKNAVTEKLCDDLGVSVDSL